MQKARGRSHEELPLLVDTGFQDLFHSPYRGSFHLSLTVLVHYRSPIDTEAYGVVPTDSWQVARPRHYLGSIAESACVSCTGLLPPVVRLSRRVLLRSTLVTPWYV